MVKPEWGTRYVCYKCGIRFYDLNKPEPICPKCNANQDKATTKATSTSARIRARAIMPVESNNEEVETSGKSPNGPDKIGLDPIDDSSEGDSSEEES